jgi:hypothetical protein
VMVSSNDGHQVFDPQERAAAKLSDTLFEITKLYVSPEDCHRVLYEILPYMDAVLSLMSAEQALEEIQRREAERN